MVAQFHSQYYQGHFIRPSIGSLCHKSSAVGQTQALVFRNADFILEDNLTLTAYANIQRSVLFAAFASLLFDH
jgi:hypothetical protein